MKKKDVSRREKLSYWFDNIMSKGTAALVGLLFLVTFIVVMVVALVAFFATPHTSVSTLGASVWQSFMCVIDAGNIAGDYGGNWLFILLMVIATICGLFVTSILIGIINAAFESKLTALRKGNSRVLERGHTLIIGFNGHIYPVLHELIIANENERKPKIVILSNRDKEEMEDLIRTNVPDTRNTKIICRSGDVSGFEDLKNVGLLSSSSVIILADDDFSAIKSVLAATTLLNDASVPDTYLTTMIYNEENLPAARIAGQERLTALYCEKTIARIIAQACRQPGLSLIYTELFSFDGDEIYMEPAPSLLGVTFGEAVMRYGNASVMGIERHGVSMLNPDRSELIQPDDRIILIAEDNGVATVTPTPFIPDEGMIAELSKCHVKAAPDWILVIGYNSRAYDVLTELDTYLSAGSHIMLAVSPETDIEFEGSRFLNFDFELYRGYIHDPGVLEEVLERDFRYIVVLSDASGPDSDHDSHTLALLLRLRDYSTRFHKSYTVVSEMENAANQKLASCARVNDFIVGSNFVASIMTQISQNRALSGVMDTLLTSEGCEIYLKPAESYVKTNVELSIETLAAAALDHNELFLGYKRTLPDGRAEIKVNPHKGQRIMLQPCDRLIVLAED